MFTTTFIIATLQQNQTYLKDRFGLESLVLFGSYARNQQLETSDLDLLYQVQNGKSMPLMRLQNLEQYISKLISGKKIELVSKNHVEPIIGSTILKEGIIVF
jgi:predicted nucleotidyltransferase